MYIRRVQIQNIRCIEELEWLPPEAAQGPGWHVVLGDNGSGKSSFLRAVSLALIGAKEAYAARQDWRTWLRRGKESASIRIEFAGDRANGSSPIIPAAVEFENSDGAVEIAFNGFDLMLFSAAFGPFRRFTGGDKETERSFQTNPRLSRHLSVFGENVALTEGLSLLRELNYKRLEDPNSDEAILLDQLIRFVNHEGFLPHRMRLSKISSDGVEFEDPNGFPIPVEELSDGYRSILSMTFELIRQLRLSHPDVWIFDADNLRVIPPGVALIDEIDAHLHPSWQRTVGFWFTEHFPNFQFIVTTHSPLICQAAVKGSIFQLPTPGTDETGRMLQGVEYERLVYGDILDAYSVEAFGAGITRSDEAERKHERLATLNVKELKQELSEDEKDEQNRLRAVFPTSS